MLANEIQHCEYCFVLETGQTSVLLLKEDSGALPGTQHEDVIDLRKV